MTNESITISLSQFNHMCKEIEELRAYKKQQQEKKGRWIGDKCSNCGNERAWYGNNPLFCPDCGARMVSE